MSEKGFEPLSSQLGIAGTSYRLQLGLINGKWASRLLKGNNVIDSYVYKDEDITSSGFPNQNMIVGWVLRTVAIPNINPHQVMKTTQALIKQAIQNKEQKKVMAPISETKKVVLEKVPESELKRPKVSGWVKEEGMTSKEDLRQAFKERLMAKKEGVVGTISSSTPVSPSHPSKPVKIIRPTRELPPIPGYEPPSTDSRVCPSCGKDLNWKFCPYCGKPLPF